MSQDTSTHDTDMERRRPSGTEDLLPDRAEEEHAGDVYEDRRDDDASVRQEQGYQEEHAEDDRVGPDGQDGTGATRLGYDERRGVDTDEDRVDRDRVDQDRLDQDRLDQDRLDQDRLDQERLDRERLDRERLDEGRLDDGRTDEHRLADERAQDRAQDRAGQWSEQGTTTGTTADTNRVAEDRVAEVRVAEDRVDGELGAMDQSQFQALPSTGQPPARSDGYDQVTPLLGPGEVEGLRTRWMTLQATFVDDPRTAVQQADQLVAEVMQTLAQMFNASKQDLEGQWQREGRADTEDLRQALRRYRVFFDQLLRS